MKKALILVVIMALLSSMCLAATMTIRPNAQGYYSAWTNTGCSSGTSEWQCVDENPANTTDNLYTSQKTVSESFAFQDTGLSNVIINSVTVYFYGIRYSSTRYMFQPLVRSSSTDYLGSVKSLTASYAYYSQVYTTNPATGAAWTVAQVDALEAGMKSYTATYGGRIAQVYAVVDYSFPDSCSDTDGGNVITTFGTVSGFYNSSAYANNDTCVDSGNINEYYCSGAYKQNQLQSCGTDSYSSNYCINSSVYKDFTDYFCTSGACGSTTTPQFVESCTYGCTGGMCNLPPDSCSDTDGGNVITTFGTVSGFYNSSAYANDDTCVDSGNINEYYCSGAYKQNQQQSCGTDFNSSKYCVGSLQYLNFTDYYCSTGTCGVTKTPQFLQNCTYGCTAGVCNNPLNTCSETDGGQRLNIAGNTSGYRNSNYYFYSDLCISNITLTEYYCIGNYSYSYNFSCAFNYTSCYSGACI
jgi:hypothetical protein